MRSQSPDPTRALPYLTAGRPGCAGRLKSRPEDFRVAELPAYAPAGRGEHLYLEIEKRGCTTREAAAHLGRCLALSPAQVGHAGLKDARAVSRQWLSLHTPADPDPRRLETEGLRVLAVSRHGNKLRPGHLRGNRFTVVVRGVRHTDGLAALLDGLVGGFPNYFGPQRFGARGDNALRGRELVRRGMRGRGLACVRLLTNAYQAWLFNQLLARRLQALQAPFGLVAGDLAVRHDSGGFFPVDAAALAEEQARADRHEISPTALLPGYRAPLAEGPAGRWEAELLAAEGVRPEDFKAGGKRRAPKGERRAVRAFARDLEWELLPGADGPALRLAFTLDGGVYATSFLREVMKPDGGDLAPDPGDPS